MQREDTPLHIAVVVGSLTAARTLVKYGADVDAQNNRRIVVFYYEQDRTAVMASRHFIILTLSEEIFLMTPPGATK